MNPLRNLTLMVCLAFSGIAYIGQASDTNSNDKLNFIENEEEDLACALNKIILTVQLDNAPNAVLWNLYNTAGEEIDSTSPYAEGNTTYTHYWCLPAGCYIFTMKDIEGNGICCDGGYTVSQAGETLFSGGNFGLSVSHNFCLGEDGLLPNDVCTPETNYVYNNFEGGKKGLWNSSGIDSFLNSPDGNPDDFDVAVGDWCWTIRDGDSVSYVYSDNLNLANFESVELRYTWTTKWMNLWDSYAIDVSYDGGTSWDNVRRLYALFDFENEVRYNMVAEIPGPYTAQTRIRVNCEGQTNFQRVHIDEVYISGCAVGTTEPIIYSPLGFSGLGSSALQFSEEEDETLTAFPNPASGEVSFEFVSGSGSQKSFYLRNQSGKIVYEQRIEIEAEERAIFEVDMQGYPAGIYHATLLDGNKTKTAKISKVD